MDASLRLDSDDRAPGPALRDHLAAEAGGDPDKQALAALVATIIEAAPPLAHRLMLGRLPGAPDKVVGVNESGDKQKALDMAAHDHFVGVLRGANVARVLSEEAVEVVPLDPEGRFDVAMDPVDGSGSIGIGAPLGTLFCIFPAGDSFLRPGREVIAAGYVSFGHSIDVGVSLGAGVTIATLDPRDGVFRVDAEAVTIPPDAKTVAFNASNWRRWSVPVTRYTEDLMLGEDGPRGRDFNMRWLAAAVGDLHRILRRGGAFLYPADDRPGYEQGYLRLAYEAFPIAFLVEQAGGAATDGKTPVLDLVPGELHDRVPLFFGARNEVAKIRDYIHHAR